MVSSHGSFSWMDGHASPNASAPTRSQRHVTLWITDHNRCVDRLLSQVESTYGDPILRVAGHLFDSPQQLLNLIKKDFTEYAIEEIVIVGHSHFLPSTRTLSSTQDNCSKEPGGLLHRMAKRQESCQQAEQRLLGVSVELAHLCAGHNHPMLANLKVDSLFYREESGAVCYYNQRTMQFEAFASER